MKEAYQEKTTFRVRYAETDAQGVAHHSSYIPWFELGRVEFCRSIGIDYAGLEASGFFLAVVSLNVKYRSPAHFDEMLVVTTQIQTLRRTSLIFSYQIIHLLTQAILTEAETVLVCLGISKRPVPFPDRVRTLFLASIGETE